MTDLQRSIIRYYDATLLDYRAFWVGKRDLAFHFGYYDTSKESHRQSLENMNRVMAGKAGMDASDLVLDAGCGQGGSALWLATHIGCVIQGISLVPHQVEMANRVAKARGLENKARFYIQDYAKTGFPEESFTVIWACESLCHAPEKKAFYQEAFRLLKPGGRLVVAEYIRKGRNNAVQDENILQNWFSGWSMPDLDTWQEHWDHMREAGFTRIQHEDITGHVSPSLHRLFKMSKRLLGLGKFLHLVRIRNHIRHRNQVASISQYVALTKNLWNYYIYTASKPGLPK
ncbi:MAG TPA: methyltransferase domain-containing protein [Saprospiraceae bacterium]|nr:methyltransferase domain-containing protein [Saprospiraceae bacterium]HNT21171.1 methyltransferase domain-containing protein [Saprospiraceae bacterium]